MAKPPCGGEGKNIYGLRTMTRKFKKIRQMEIIVIHPQNAPIYNVKYRKEESEVKAQIELIKE